MPLKTSTFYQLGRDLDGIAPGYGLTVDYDLLEGLIASMKSPLPPANLRNELRELADDHHCEFKDFQEHRFVQFVKRTV